MKSRVWIITKKVKIIFLICLLIMCAFAILNKINSKFEYAKEEWTQEKGKPIVEKSNIQQTSTTNTIQEKQVIKERILPMEEKGYEIIGQLKIDKINLTTYILKEMTQQSLEVSVAKLCGPEINAIGNFCIVGHNYMRQNMFSNLRKLEIGDTFKLTDAYGKVVEYEIYYIEKIDPKDTTCLSQNTQQDKEVTLITCTIGALKRLVIKAVEIYD